MSITQKTVDLLKRIETGCPHCGRNVIVGPPCCYESLSEAYSELEQKYSALQKEANWLRKVQSKKDKKIHELEQKLKRLLGMEEV